MHRRAFPKRAAPLTKPTAPLSDQPLSSLKQPLPLTYRLNEPALANHSSTGPPAHQRSSEPTHPACMPLQTCTLTIFTPAFHHSHPSQPPTASITPTHQAPITTHRVNHTNLPHSHYRRTPHSTHKNPSRHLSEPSLVRAIPRHLTGKCEDIKKLWTVLTNYPQFKKTFFFKFFYKPNINDLFTNILITNLIFFFLP